MKKLLKRLIIGTALEVPARLILNCFTHQSHSTQEWSLRGQRDNQNIRKILCEVLTKNSNCIDIGAHKGTFLQCFLELSPDGHHYAFEPLPELVLGLKEKYPQVEVYNYALSDENAQAMFFMVPNMLAWSGLKTQQYPKEVHLLKIEVETKRLDEIIPDDVDIDFIKIDVEGAELLVFKGAESTIKRCKPYILFEHAQIHTMEYGATPEMVYDFLSTECGLSIWSLDGDSPLTKDKFVSICQYSFASNYDRHAETNFLACFI